MAGWWSEGRRDWSVRPTHGMTAAVSSFPAQVDARLLQSPPFLWDTFLREMLPRLLWEKGAQEKAPCPQINPPIWLMVLGRKLCPTVSLPPLVQPASQLLGLWDSPLADRESPWRWDSPHGSGQSPCRRALTRWPQSCPCPSPRSSGHGQPSLQAAQRRSNNNPPGS